MRLGVAAQTVNRFVWQAFATKAEKAAVERAFNITSDLGLVGETLCRKGIEGLNEMHVMVGNPIRAMLAERLPSPEEILEKMGGRAMFEYKYDGLRVQAHIDGSKITLYSRRLEDLTDQFPDVVKALGEEFIGQRAILEGECVPVDINTGEMLPFQEVSQRRGRKHGLTEAIEITRCVSTHSTVYLEGRDLTTEPLPDRRTTLTRSRQGDGGRAASEARVIDRASQGPGVLHKRPSTRGARGSWPSPSTTNSYPPGSRASCGSSTRRSTLEMNDTVDLVVVGGFMGAAREAVCTAPAYGDTTGRDASRPRASWGSGFDDAPSRAPRSWIGSSSRPGISAGGVEDGGRRVVRASLVLEVLGAELSISPIHTSAHGA